MYSRFALVSTIKNSLKWIFFFVVYPYVVMSTVYDGGASFTGLLFSYVTIAPTLLAIKVVRSLKERSINVNEYLSKIAKEQFDYNNYSRAVVGLKILRIVLLIVLSLLFAKWLLKLFSLSAVISTSLSSFLIALLQIYYMAIIVISIKYEA